MAPSGYANYTNVPDSLPAMKVSIVDFCPSRHAAYGALYEDPYDAIAAVRDTCDGPVAEGMFTVWREGQLLRAHNKGVGSDPYTTARLHGRSWVTREMNRHPDGPQAFIPVERQPFTLLLGVDPDCLVGRAALTRLMVFRFDGTRSVVIHRNVMHQPPYGLGTFYTAQAASHLCEAYDTVDEDRKWLNIGPLP